MFFTRVSCKRIRIVKNRTCAKNHASDQLLIMLAIFYLIRSLHWRLSSNLIYSETVLNTDKDENASTWEILIILLNSPGTNLHSGDIRCFNGCLRTLNKGRRRQHYVRWRIFRTIACYPMTKSAAEKKIFSSTWKVSSTINRFHILFRY